MCIRDRRSHALCRRTAAPRACSAPCRAAVSYTHLDVYKRQAVDGVLTGVGSVLTFLPIIVVLFLFLSILEDSGYMARVAFVMDKVLRR